MSNWTEDEVPHMDDFFPARHPTMEDFYPKGFRFASESSDFDDLPEAFKTFMRPLVDAQSAGMQAELDMLKATRFLMKFTDKFSREAV